MSLPAGKKAGANSGDLPHMKNGPDALFATAIMKNMRMKKQAMKCKDCIHYEAHRHFYKPSNFEHDFDDDFKDNGVEWMCPEFKEKSRFIEIPCKVGDIIYLTDGFRIYESRIKSILYDSGLGKVICDTDGIAFDVTAIKEKRVFLSHAEAEKALKEREKNEC